MDTTKLGFFKSGTPWVWLNAAAVSISMVMVIGLLILIAVRGLGHFWPKTISTEISRREKCITRKIPLKVYENPSFMRRLVFALGTL